jgi:glutaredoxin
MAERVVFYHAGCPVCFDAEQAFLGLLDRQAFELEVVHLGVDKHRLSEAKSAGVKSVPALVVGGKVYHINFGAALSDLE